MLNITVTQAGALTVDPSSKGDTATIIFARIRVLTPEGQAILNLSLEAAEELAKTLQALLAAKMHDVTRFSTALRGQAAAIRPAGSV
jgi:hypothetical protein